MCANQSSGEKRPGSPESNLDQVVSGVVSGIDYRNQAKTEKKEIKALPVQEATLMAVLMSREKRTGGEDDRRNCAVHDAQTTGENAYEVGVSVDLKLHQVGWGAA